MVRRKRKPSRQEPDPSITVVTQVLPVPNSKQAADLFARILRSVRSADARRKEQHANDGSKNES
jgi:hypothetical protein